VKKSFLICLIAAFLVMVIGMVICITAQNKAEAQNIDLFKDGFNEDGNMVVTYALDLVELTKINMIIPEADVEIIGCADSSRIELVNFHSKTYSASNKNGVFEFSDEFNISSLLNLSKNDFSFNGIRSLFNLGRIFTDSKKVRIYLSGKDDVDLSLSIEKGDVSLSNVEELKDIYIALEEGNVNADGIYSDSATVSISKGNCSVSLSEIKKLSVKLHEGDISYETHSYGFHNVNAETEEGDIKILGTSEKSPFSIVKDLAYLELNAFTINGNIEIKGK